jgi:hypothetical protein
MTNGIWDIEAVVAEVLRRLRQLASVDASAVGPPVPAASPVSAPSPALVAPATSVVAAATPVIPIPSAVASQPDDLVLDESVVTLQMLDGRLKQIHRVLVRPRAVVTPSVRDELKKRNIRLEYRQEETVPTKSAGELLIVRCAQSPTAVETARELNTPDGARVIVCDDLRSAAHTLASTVRDARRIGVLLTDETWLAVSLVNRSPVVRGACVRSVDEARAAITALGANVLIVDPAAVAGHVWNELLDVFRADLPRRCPGPLASAGQP